METADVSCIIRLRVNSDGDGVRSVVFLYGCPLSCVWCCNPETRFGGKFKTLTTAELYELIKRDEIYFRETNGGVTFSGGEPLLHAAFIQEFCEQYGNDMTVNIETSLCSDFEVISMLIPYINEWMVDWKQADAALHAQFTGYSNSLIHENLKKLASEVDAGKITVTYPVIPGYTDQDENVGALIEFMHEAGLSRIEYHPYRKRREEKYRKAGLSFSVIPSLDRDKLWAIEKRISATGIKTVKRDMAVERRKCDVLKDIRKQVAARHELDVDFRECTFRGRCAGTCPKCEEELSQINQQLSQRETWK